MSAVQPLAITTSRPSSSATITVNGPGGVVIVAWRASVGTVIRHSSEGRARG